MILRALHPFSLAATWVKTTPKVAGCPTPFPFPFAGYTWLLNQRGSSAATPATAAPTMLPMCETSTMPVVPMDPNVVSVMMCDV